jgi:uncharacterized protein (TIGR02117 family)
VAVGWGDRGFYLETPRWADLKASTVFRALFVPSESVLHVEYLTDPISGQYIHEVLVTRHQYQRIVEFVRATVGAVDEQGAAELASEVTYGPLDRFYRARGSYHLFNSCNQWTGRGLARAGVPVGIWTPLKIHVLWWLPRPATPDRLPDPTANQSATSVRRPLSASNSRIDSTSRLRSMPPGSMLC